MTHQLSDSVRNAMADGFETAIGTAPTLQFRTGTPPANAAAADSGTLLGSITLPSDWLSAAVAGVKSLLGTWAGAMSAAGIIGHYRIKQGATCHAQGLVSEPWQASKVYATGYQVVNGANLYRATTGGTSASSGGPTGNGTGITDGTVTWAFVQVGADMGIDNASVNSGQNVQVNSYTLTQQGA